MSAQLSSTLASSSLVERGAVKLWSAGKIAGVCFFFGFPGAVTMAAINWYRLGLTRKAIGHIGAVVLVAIVAVLVSMFIAPGAATALVLLSSLVFLVELYQQTKADLAAYEASGGRADQAGLGGGILLALAAFLGWVVVVFSIAFTLAIFTAVLMVLAGVPLVP